MNDWLKRKQDRECHVITVRYRCDNDLKWIDFDLHEDRDPYDIYLEISKRLWWPSGNMQGVYDAVIRNDIHVDLYSPGHRIFSSSVYDVNSYCDFEYGIDSRYILRMNRFYISIDDRVKKHCFVGGSVAYPTGWNGCDNGLGQNVIFGLKVTT